MDNVMKAMYFGIGAIFLVAIYLIVQNVINPPPHVPIEINQSMAQAYCANQTAIAGNGCTGYDNGKLCSDNESSCVIQKQLCYASTNTPGDQGWNTSWNVSYCQIPNGDYGLVGSGVYKVNIT
jgi:hypothetical protein